MCVRVSASSPNVEKLPEMPATACRLSLIAIISLTLCTTSCIKQSTSSTEHSNSTRQRSAAIVAEWSKWVAKHNVTRASIAISYNGELVEQKGKWSKATSPAPVASLSKAITGICILQLVDNGLLTYDTQLQSIIPELPAKVSIASLLTHSSGFRKDITQQPADYPGVDQEYLMWVSQQELASGTSANEGDNYSYNNSNYAMLGAVISKLTRKTYEQACSELVLEPPGISSASLNPKWRIMSSWGGWKISSADYLKFVNAYFGHKDVQGKSPHDLPNFALNGGASYGMGYLFRPGRNGGYNFWHSGRWHTNRGGVKYRFGSFFAQWDNGWAVSTNYNISAINGEDGELDRLLATAAHRQ